MIKVREEYKKRLKKILTQEQFVNLMSLTNDREAFLDELTILSVVYFIPGTDKPSEATYELEDLFALISADS